MRSIVSFFKLFIFLLWAIISIPLQGLSTLLFRQSKTNTSYAFPTFCSKVICAIYNIQIEIKGTPDKTNHVVFVGNHLSYIDIPAIASTIPATFISKADVKKWPIFGVLAILAQTVFIERSRHAVDKCIQDIKKALDKDRSLVLFPEGTSTQGLNVLPFKSTIFALFLHPDLKQTLYVQPFTLSIQTVNGKAVQKPEDHDLYAWYADMTLLPHLWDLGKSTGIGVKIEFHPARASSEYEDRKQFAQDCHADVQRGLDNSLPTDLDLNLKAP